MLMRYQPVMLSPIFGLEVQWTGFFILMGLLLSWSLIKWLSRRQKMSLSSTILGSSMTWMVIFVLAGGRIGYALFFDQNMFFQFRADSPYWGLLALGEGGFSLHGCMIGAVLGSLFLLFRHDLSQAYVLDVTALIAPLILMLSRFGSFLSGEQLEYADEMTLARSIANRLPVQQYVQ